VKERVIQHRMPQHTVIIVDVVQQHANEAAGLWTLRKLLATAPRAGLFELGRSDDRLAAHLDGLSVAGDDGWPFCEAMLEDGLAGAVFVAAVRAIEEKQRGRLDPLFALAEANPERLVGVTSAFGWIERQHLQGTVAELLKSPDPTRRLVGLAACAMHGADPGPALAPSLEDPVPAVRSRAVRAAGELGLGAALPACAALLADDDPDCWFWAAWAAVLLGDRGRALDALTRIGSAEGQDRARAFRLALQAMPESTAHALLQVLAKDPAQLRWLIQGSGIAGDSTYMPWLIGHTGNPVTARLAGEALSLITGADLAWLDLERKPPEDFESGPNDDPNDPNVDMDPDDGLPWPDQEKVAKWWAANATRFQKGQRFFMGEPVSREHCIDVLKNGYQRQRILAAHYLCLLNPGTPLFNTSAPAWRQQRLLATMT
jgi:uncharacterized protein (TIGR02270 family)